MQVLNYSLITQLFASQNKNVIPFFCPCDMNKMCSVFVFFNRLGRYSFSLMPCLHCHLLLHSSDDIINQMLRNCYKWNLVCFSFAWFRIFINKFYAFCATRFFFATLLPIVKVVNIFAESKKEVKDLIEYLQNQISLLNVHMAVEKLNKISDRFDKQLLQVPIPFFIKSLTQLRYLLFG